MLELKEGEKLVVKWILIARQRVCATRLYDVICKAITM